MELFDGRTLAGWAQAGPGGFDVVDGALVSRGGMGLLWSTTPEVADFVLEVGWRTERPSDNGGVFLRFPDPGDDPWLPVHAGYEVQILDDAEDPTRATAAIYTFAAPRLQASLPPGSWNRFTITARGHDLAVALNGTEVTRHRGDRRLHGHVGLQNHDDASRVAYRDIRLTELTPARP